MKRSNARTRLLILSSLILIIHTSSVPAQNSSQNPPPAKAFQVVILNLNSPAVDSYIPFDEPFLMEAEVPEGIAYFECRIVVSRKKGKVRINHQKYTAIPIENEATGKFIAQFIVDPIPPNSRVNLTVTVRKHVAELTEYTNSVRSAIGNVIKELVREGTGYTPERLTPVQITLQNKLSAEFPGYTADFKGTILDNSNWQAAGPSFNRLFTHYNLAFTTIASLNKNSPPPSPVNDAPTMRDAFRYARLTGNERVANALQQIVFTTDSDWQLLAMGLMRIDASSSTPPPFPNLIFPSPDMPASELMKMQAHVDETIAALAIAGSYLSTNVAGDPSALAAINGRAYASGMETRFLNVINDLQVTQGRLISARTSLAVAIGALNQYEATFNSIIQSFRFTLEDQRLLTATSSQAFETRGRWYIGADAGLVFVPKISEVQPYYGSNIYFSPINKNASYNREQLKRTYGATNAIGLWMAKHTCLHIGIIPNSIANSERRVETLWGNNTAMLGAGLRLGSSFRLTAGAALFRSYRGDLLDNRRQLAATPYISASVDINLVKFFGSVGIALGLANPASGS